MANDAYCPARTSSSETVGNGADRRADVGEVAARAARGIDDKGLCGQRREQHQAGK
jgi:hypothetical protein